MHCPYIVGGDFNILRHSGEKNTTFTPSHYFDLFNTIIHSLGPREIFMHGGKYTWSNKQAIPTMEKLDRVLMSPNWEDLFPLVHVRKQVRDISDHNALLLFLKFLYCRGDPHSPLLKQRVQNIYKKSKNRRLRTKTKLS
jgi:endonuclease/exonuclease/phosphatase family metal-dependent hydrolase